MAAATEDFASWLARAEIPVSRLTPQVEAVLRAVLHSRQEQGCDYSSTRLLSRQLHRASTWPWTCGQGAFRLAGRDNTTGAGAKQAGTRGKWLARGDRDGRA